MISVLHIRNKKKVAQEKVYTDSGIWYSQMRIGSLVRGADDAKVMVKNQDADTRDRTPYIVRKICFTSGNPDHCISLFSSLLQRIGITYILIGF